MVHFKTAARRAAMQVLAESERTDKPLAALLDALPLPPQARPFAREIASGTVRHRARADHALRPLLRKPLEKLDAPVRAALRLAAYERIVLETPAHVVANEYAGAMRAAHLTSAVAFVNAVARRLPAGWPASPDAAHDPVAFLATEYSHPTWLVERWLHRLGFDECIALCHSNNVVAPLCLRVNTRLATQGGVLSALLARGLQARVGVLSPDAIVVERAGAPDEWPEWKAGHIMAQDEAAQLVGRFAARGIEESLSGASAAVFTAIDACAAPGGKTTHLAQMMNEGGRVIACDVAAGRLKLVRDNARRLQLANVETRPGDFRELASTLPPADLVLLDAPCLGTGTLRRRPDAKWRKTRAQLDEIVALQRALLDAAARVVRPGGAMVYATCSLEPEENEEQARAFVVRHPDWRIAPPLAEWGFSGSAEVSEDAQNNTLRDEEREAAHAARSLMTEEGFLQTRPHHHGCDGAFAARFVRAAD